MHKSHFGYVTSLRSAALAIALSAVTGTASADVFDQLDKDFSGQLRSRSQLILPGAEVEVSGNRFKPGQKITLQRGTTVLNAEPYVADADGSFSATIKVPENAAIGIHPIVVVADGPDAASIFELKVSKKLDLAGADKFAVESKKAGEGIYQVDYSAASDALFVTSAVGRQVSNSSLIKIDPKTLEVVASVSAPKADDDSGRVHAIYGVGVDDANGNVWVTNTRSGTVAVYKQSDLSLVKQFESGAVPHSRDVIVDTKNNRVYASGNEPSLAVFDAKTLEALPPVELTSRNRGETFFPMSLHIDKDSGKLYTVSLRTAEVAVVDLASGKVDKIFSVPNAKSASGIAFDSANKRVLIANQATDNLVIVDPETEKVVYDVYVGVGALNVAYEPVSKLAFVSCRGADTVTVVNGNGEVVAVLDGGSFPNHLQEDGKGNIYAVNKARGSDDPKGDFIHRISPKK